MKKLFCIFWVLLLCGCNYVEVYVNEETEIYRQYTSTRHDYIVDVLADVEVVLYPNFTYFQPGYDNPHILIHVISKNPSSIYITNVKFINIDTGFQYENIVNETLTTASSVSLNGIKNLDYFGGGIRLLDKKNYSNFYGALEIDMTVLYSVDGAARESKTFRLKRITKSSFILSV